ncbi:SHOCT domain-containing protein [Terracoccus sp. 273MFTsu3.1]|uniref:SHOCT domain-containing protein n=1 Tax=Terracoccus sp. 273MFTsu3.1 TaxID=1172188 RepID=UPI0003608A5B|nr:SHOCT domain-containing protein [Terracoccus sp. 273MFTsu3.1]
MSFWDIVWFIIIFFAFASYLMVLFSIVADLFRDPQVSGGMKALWVVCLVFFTFITAIVYLIVRGRGMNERAAQKNAEARQAQEEYVRAVAGASSTSAPEQIAKAKELLDSGTISADEFAALKAKALA